MAEITTRDDVSLYYEDTGMGTPIVFVHEFAGDARSWEPQVRHFARRYRCITFNARGYPPSAVPPAVSSYSQEHARDDILAVLDALGLAQAHIVGLSMGAFATLHFGLTYPARARTLVVAGCGYGAHPDGYAEFQAHARSNAELISAPRASRRLPRAMAMGPGVCSSRPRIRAASRSSSASSPITRISARPIRWQAIKGDAPRYIV